MKRYFSILLLAILFFNCNRLYAVSEATDSIPAKQTIIENVVSWYMEHMNYGTITLLMAVESSFIPLPSEIVVPPAAYVASQEGSHLNMVLVILFATLGALLGSTFNYFLALFLGRPIVYRFAESKIGRMCLLSQEKVKKAEDYFIKHGKVSTLIGRLVPGIRHLISIPAGLARMPYGSFLLFTFIGAMVWNIILAALGYIAYDKKELFSRYDKELSYVLLGLGIIFVLYLVYNGFIKKKKTTEQTIRK